MMLHMPMIYTRHQRSIYSFDNPNFGTPIHSAATKPETKLASKRTNVTVPGVPPEIIRIILGFLSNDKKTLAACALVNSTFNIHTTPTLYQTISFTFPHNFTQFSNVTNKPSYRSNLVRHLDLSSFSTVGLQKPDVAVQKVVTPQILIPILRSCTNLEAFLVSESLESTITVDVLRTLMLECKNIKAMDFCGCASKEFAAAMNALVTSLDRVKIVPFQETADSEIQFSFMQNVTPALPHIKRLSLHKCLALSEYSTIIPLLAHTPNLTHLDLGGCVISDLTLQFLTTETNVTSTLTHLSVAKCKNLSSDAIATFVSQCKRLEHLNLYGKVSISEWDLCAIVSSPYAKNFSSLDIGSSHITPRVLNAIKENCAQSLKYLGIAKAEISTLDNITAFLRSMPELRYVDLTNVQCLTMINTNILVTKLNKSKIHTIEMGQSLLEKMHPVQGWKIDQSYGRRGYYARKQSCTRPNQVHSRKLNVVGKVEMSEIFRYYSFGI